MRRHRPPLALLIKLSRQIFFSLIAEFYHRAQPVVEVTLPAFRAATRAIDGTFWAIFCTWTILDLRRFQRSNSHGLVADFDSNIGIVVATLISTASVVCNGLLTKTMMRKYLLSVLVIIAGTIIAAETAEVALDANGNTAKILIPDDFTIEE